MNKLRLPGRIGSAACLLIALLAGEANAATSQRSLDAGQTAAILKGYFAPLNPAAAEKLAEAKATGSGSLWGVIRGFPETKEAEQALFELGLIAGRQGDRGAATTPYQLLQADRPGSPEARVASLRLGQLRLEWQEFPEARRLFEACLSSSKPGVGERGEGRLRVEALLGLAAACDHPAGDRARAFEIYRQVVREFRGEEAALEGVFEAAEKALWNKDTSGAERPLRALAEAVKPDLYQGKEGAAVISPDLEALYRIIGDGYAGTRVRARALTKLAEGCFRRKDRASGLGLLAQMLDEFPREEQFAERAFKMALIYVAAGDRENARAILELLSDKCTLDSVRLRAKAKLAQILNSDGDERAAAERLYREVVAASKRDPAIGAFLFAQAEAFLYEDRNHPGARVVLRALASSPQAAAENAGVGGVISLLDGVARVYAGTRLEGLVRLDEVERRYELGEATLPIVEKVYEKLGDDAVVLARLIGIVIYQAFASSPQRSGFRELLDRILSEQLSSGIAERGGPALRLEFARALRHCQRPEEAIQQLRVASSEIDPASQRPVSARVAAELGELYREAGQKDRALREFERAASVDPNSPKGQEAQFQAAELLVNSSPAEAERRFRAMLEKYPRTPSGAQALWQLSRLERLRGQIDEQASEYIKQVIEDPRWWREREDLRFWLVRELGHRYTDQKRYDDALSVYERFEKTAGTEEDKFWACYFVVETLQNAGRRAEAVRSLEEILARDLSAGLREKALEKKRELEATGQRTNQ
jgi:tetratricopeptide (TPR) repeat protein